MDKLLAVGAVLAVAMIVFLLTFTVAPLFIQTLNAQDAIAAYVEETLGGVDSVPSQVAGSFWASQWTDTRGEKHLTFFRIDGKVAVPVEVK